MKYVITALLLIASSVVHGQVYVHWQEEQTIYNGAGDATVRRSCHASDGAFVVKTYHYQATAPELAELNLYGRDDGYVTEVSLLLGAVLAERRRLAEDLVLANPPGDTPAISNESALLPGPEHAFRTFRYRFQVDTEWIYPPRGGWYERRGQDTTETAILPVYNPTSLGRISFTPLMQTNPKTSVTLSLSLADRNGVLRTKTGRSPVLVPCKADRYGCFALYWKCSHDSHLSRWTRYGDHQYICEVPPARVNS